MNKLDAILKLNDDFYKDAAVSFSKTRRGFWEGWGRVADTIDGDLPDKIKVLDVGCGNGRFFRFLKERFEHLKIIYTGLDNNDGLLSEAKRNYPDGKFAKCNFLEYIPEEKYDLVVGFGVTHHIPTGKLQLEFFKKLGGAVEVGGYLVATFWEFNVKKALDVPRFKKLLGKNDYILGWENKPNLYRYCHLYDSEEKKQINNLVNSVGLKLVEEFLDKGEDVSGSHYFIWRKN